MKYGQIKITRKFKYLGEIICNNGSEKESDVYNKKNLSYNAEIRHYKNSTLHYKNKI